MAGLQPFPEIFPLEPPLVTSPTPYTSQANTPTTSFNGPTTSLNGLPFLAKQSSITTVNTPFASQQNSPRDSLGSDDESLLAPTEWKTSVVTQWLRTQMQEKYGDIWIPTTCIRRLTENLVDGETVGNLSQEDWRELIPLMGPRAYAIHIVNNKFRPPSSYGSYSYQASSPQHSPKRAVSGISQISAVSAVSAVTSTLVLPPPSKAAQPQPVAAAPPTQESKPETPAVVTFGNIPMVDVPPKDSPPPHPCESSMLLEPEGQPRGSLMFPGHEPNPVNTSVCEDVKGLFGQSNFTNARVAKDLNHCQPRLETNLWGRFVFKMKLTLYITMYYLYAVMLKTVRISDVLVLCLAAGVTLVFFLCGLFLSYNPTLIITPVIFPITFTISSAYRRREDALASLAAFRTSCGIILVSHGSWCLELYGTKDKRFKGWTPPSFFGNSMQCIREIQKCAEQYLGPSNDFTEKGRKEALRKAYYYFAKLNQQGEILRAIGIPPPLLARTIGDVHGALESFERLQVMRDYQTPATIKMYNLIALPLMVVFVAPYFAYLLDVYPDQRGLIFVLNLLLIFVTALLLSVQKKMECPFGRDEDGINLHTTHLASTILGEQRTEQIEEEYRQAEENRAKIEAEEAERQKWMAEQQAAAQEAAIAKMEADRLKKEERKERRARELKDIAAKKKEGLLAKAGRRPTRLDLHDRPATPQRKESWFDGDNSPKRSWNMLKRRLSNPDDLRRANLSTKSTVDLRHTTSTVSDLSEIVPGDVRPAGDLRGSTCPDPEQTFDDKTALDESFGELVRDEGRYGNFFDQAPSAAAAEEAKEEEDDLMRDLTMYRAPVAGLLSPLPPQPPQRTHEATRTGPMAEQTTMTRRNL